MLGGLAYWIYRQPFVFFVVLALAVMIYIQTVLDKRRQRRLAASREGESICDFARSFDRRTDTWIIRSVYEELSRFLAIDDRSIPVRRQDRWEKDLGIDPEDLDDLATDVAFRARRAMNDCDKNPLYGKVETVGDIVTFLEHQTRIVEPAGPDQPATRPERKAP
jgi:hypothetical protein